MGELGRGGFGVVYKGHDPGLGRYAAIKVMDAARARDPDLVARFWREARAAAALAHRNIVTVYECGEHEGVPYIAMEFLGEGRDLEEVIRSRREMPLERKVDAVRQAAEGLHFAHTRGVIHRDVKPSNIRLMDDGTVKILDFGLAHTRGSDLTHSGQVFGTAAYISPEQLRGQPADARSDVFSLGVVLYELLVGRRPFEGKTEAQVIEKVLEGAPVTLDTRVPDWLADVVRRCLENDPRRRFASAQALADALRAALVAPRLTDGETAAFPSPAAPAPARRLSASAPSEEAHFTPGAVLGGRYRIVALLGRGGMGEVYRAEDTKLGHTVALKFLPRSLAADPARRERLYAEVRVGRQVSHPNVCRLYDVVETDGHAFLAMEYVDGEDLESLLRRIGRLPVDKALEIARELGAGLAAAHDRGVVHRDLKPANVMIDGRGAARLTDFGLAVLFEEARGAGESAGTPAYMAPEQLEGREATPHSDLYALGLVLFEMFTGKRRFDARSLPELLAQHRERRPLSLSSTVRDLPAAVERVIARCLEEDPAARPPSAHAVLAALPGGDPLQAALEAGETPSPTMVAAAGKVGDLSPAVAWVCLAATLGGMVLSVGLARRSSLISRVSLPKSPEVLAERGREVAGRLGYGDPPVGRAGLFAWDDPYMRWIARHDPSPGRWDTLASRRPAPISFYYIQSPRELVAANQDGRVVPDDPPLTLPGMVEVVLDPDGRLTSFTAVPPQEEELKAAPPAPDWNRLLAEAGLDPALLRPTEPAWAAPVDSDGKAAWKGSYPGQPDITIRVEAASYHGRPVWFSVLGPWSGRLRADRMQVTPTAQGAVTAFLVALILAELGGVLLAIRNLRIGRGDRRGAWRLAILTFVSTLAATLVRADHVSTLAAEWTRLTLLVARALYWAAVVCMVYLALEPYVRRRWPRALISWNRLLAGRVGDPMVGRDVLIGGAVGVGLVMSGAVILGWIPSWLGLVPLTPRIGTTISTLSSVRHVVWALVWALPFGLGQALVAFCLLLLLRVLLRKDALAVAGLALVFFTFSFGIVSRGENLAVESFGCAFFAVATVTLTVRGGLLALASACYFAQVLASAPLTLDLSVWYAGRTLLLFVVLAAVAAYAFHTSLAGKPLFGTALLDE